MVKSKLLTILLATTTLAVLTSANSEHVKTCDTEILWGDIEIEDYYNLNSTFNLPTRTATINSENVEVSATLIYPDGSTTKHKNVNLTQSGKYSVIYTAKHNENVFAKEEHFTVRYGIASLSSQSSSIVYGKHTYCENQEGLLVRLAEDDNLYFNNIIDVSSLTRSTNLLTLYATPDVQGSTDFSHFNIKLEDVENPDKYFILNIKQTPENDTDPISYLKARANNQTLTGLLADGTPTTTTWGAKLYHSFSGTYFGDPRYYDSWWNILKVSYDNATKCIYVNDSLIIDFDDPDHFPSIWGGFDSNNVRLSISCDQYHAKTANFCITNALGVDLTADYVEDNDAPVISINSSYEEMPVAIKGQHYKVFDATATDIFSGVCEVETKAYFNYTSNNPYLIDIKDGKIETNKCGSYAIVYKSTDKIGNEAVKELTFSCVEKEKIDQLYIDSTFDTTTCKVGETISIPRNVSLGGGSGDLSYKIFAKFGNESYEINGDEFVPEKIGNWQIVYMVEDFVGQTAQKSFDVSVGANDKCVFNSKIVLPKIFIEDSDYTLPNVQAADYSSGSKVLVNANNVKVEDANGINTYQPGSSFKPKVNNSGDKIKISYSCNSSYSEIFEIPVIKAWDIPSGSDRKQLQMQNYFYGDGFDVTLNSSNATFTATQEGNVSWLFANTLIASNFSLVLSSIPSKSNYDGLKITLTDSLDENIKVSIDVMKDGSNSSSSFDNFGTLFDFGFKDSSKTNNLNLKFDGENFILNTIYKFNVTKTVDGESFTGFHSNKFYLEVEMINCEINSAFNIENISGQVIYNSTIDRVKPTLVSFDEYTCNANIGDVVTIKPSFIAGDVLDPNTESFLSVLSPSNEIVKDIYGNLLSEVSIDKIYQIKISELGQYKVQFVVSDVFGTRINKYEYSYAINVSDSIAPIIHFSSKFQSSVKVGENIILPNITLEDNYSVTEKIVLIRKVINPNGKTITLPEHSNSVKATCVGDYEIQIFAIDEAGNTTYYSCIVSVTD